MMKKGIVVLNQNIVCRNQYQHKQTVQIPYKNKFFNKKFYLKTNLI